MAPPSTLTPAQLARDLSVSMTGALASVQPVLSSLIAAGIGTVLITGGRFPLRPMAALASLGNGKAGLRNLALCMAEEPGPRGIRLDTVTNLATVAPGTPFDPAAIAEAY